MWISKKDYQELVARVKQLELKTQDINLYSNYDYDLSYFRSYPFRVVTQVTLWDAIHKILDHLKVSLVAVEGRQATFELKKK